VVSRVARAKAALVLDLVSSGAAATSADGLDRRSVQSTKLKKLELEPWLGTLSAAAATEAAALRRTRAGARMDSGPAA
jgi:hypothetical protein